MNGHYRTIASLGVISLFIFGGVLTATAARTADERTQARASGLLPNEQAAAPPNAWSPKGTDWPTFHDNNARTGLTSATATMKLANYKWTAKTGGQVISSPAVATVNTTMGGSNAPDTKVFVGSYDNRLYCIDGKTGVIVWRYQATGTISSSPAVGDINGDGIPEIVFGCDDCRVYALRGNNGTLLWKFMTRDVVVSSPALVDLKGDGMLETVIGSEDYKIYAINPDGTLLWSARPNWFECTRAAIVAADINGDQRPEIVLRTEEDDTFALNASDGKTLWEYQSPVNSHSINGIVGGPSVADLDGDGKMEVLAIDSPNGLSSVDGVNGTPKWQQVFTGDIISTPAIGDTDNDGKLDIVFSTSNNAVICIDGQAGEIKWTHDFNAIQHTSPALADIDGDGRLEVVIGGSDHIMHCLNAEDGTVRWAYPCVNTIQSSPAIADIDGDGKAEVVFGCNDGRVYALDYNF